MSQSPDDRSGRNPDWVVELTDISAAECNQFTADLGDVPLLACDATGGCPNPAEWLVSFHGCSQLFACDVHRMLWAAGITGVIENRGLISCEVCGIVMFTLGGSMQWRPI